MKIYKKYLFKHILKYFLLILFIITSIIWITRIINYLDFITEYGLNLKKFILITTLSIPSLLIITTPLSLFISVLYVYDKLIQNNEIVILQNIGIKKFKLLKPTILLSTIVSILLYLNVFFIIPNSNKKFDLIKDSMQSDIINLMFKNDEFDNIQNITFYAEATENKDLENIILYIKNKNTDETDKLIYAKTAKIINNKFLLLNDGVIQEFEENKTEKNISLFFKIYNIDLTEYYDLNLKTNNFDIDFLNIFELLKLENKDLITRALIINNLFSPLISILLSILSCLMILNKKFSRLNNDFQVVKIYSICLVYFSLFMYLFKVLDKNQNNYILLLIYSIFLILLSILLIKKKNV